MRNETNCKNCGAVLHYNQTKRLALCPYCKTEYHLDNLGMIEEYKVELEVMGQRMMFYIGSVTVENEDIDTYRNLDGYCRKIIGRRQIRLELISI